MTDVERECRNSWEAAHIVCRVEAASSKLPGFPAWLRGDTAKSYVISTPGMPSWARDVFISGYTAVTTKEDV